MKMTKKTVEAAGFHSFDGESFLLTHREFTFTIELGYKDDDGLIVKISEHTETFQSCKSIKEFRQAALEFLFDDSISSRIQKEHPEIEVLKEFGDTGFVCIDYALRNPTKESLSALAQALRELADIQQRKKTFIRKSKELLRKWVYQN